MKKTIIRGEPQVADLGHALDRHAPPTMPRDEYVIFPTTVKMNTVADHINAGSQDNAALSDSVNFIHQKKKLKLLPDAQIDMKANPQIERQFIIIEIAWKRRSRAGHGTTRAKSLV